MTKSGFSVRHYIIDNCVIVQGEELLIEPGVEVRFLNQSALTINGTMTAEGQEGDSIRFTNGSEDRSEWGQGLRFEGEQSRGNLSYVVIENQIVLNIAHNNYPGAAFFHGGESRIDNCSFRNCFGWVGGISAYGLGVDLEIRNSEIVGNRAWSSVGGIMVGFGSKVIDCVIAGNTLADGGWLGGLYVFGTDRGAVEDSLVVTGCKIFGNESSGMFLGQSNCRSHIAYNEVYNNAEHGLCLWTVFGRPILTVEYMTVYGNGGNGALGEGSPDVVEITNSILWGNGDVDFNEGCWWDYPIDIAFSNVGTWEVWGGIDGDGMIFDNPRFFDAEGMIDGTPDFRLRADSPCIGTGQDGTDMGAHPFDGEEEELNIVLVDGWSSLGLRVLPEIVDIRELFAELVEDENLILLKNDEGEFYIPEWDFCNIDHWVYSEGYQIKLNEAAEFTVQGVRVATDEPIDMEQGWNIISYYRTEPIDVREAFASIEDQVILVKNYSGQFWSPEFGGRFDMQPDQGYWVKVTQDTRFAYPVEIEEENRIREANAWDLWNKLITAYQIENTHSTMNIVVKYAQITNPGHIIAKERNGNVFGVGQCMPGHCKVVLYGDDATTSDQDGFAEESLIELWYSNTGGKTYRVEPATGEIHYQTDGYEVIDASIQEFVKVPNEYCLLPAFPNPFNASTMIGYDLPEPGQTRIEVFSLRGESVVLLLDDEIPAGQHNVPFDAVYLPSGIYTVKMQCGDFTASQKLVVLK